MTPAPSSSSQKVVAGRPLVAHKNLHPCPAGGWPKQKSRRVAAPRRSISGTCKKPPIDRITPAHRPAHRQSYSLWHHPQGMEAVDRVQGAHVVIPQGATQAADWSVTLLSRPTVHLQTGPYSYQETEEQEDQEIEDFLLGREVFRIVRQGIEDQAGEGAYPDGRDRGIQSTVPGTHRHRCCEQQEGVGHELLTQEEPEADAQAGGQQDQTIGAQQWLAESHHRAVHRASSQAPPLGRKAKSSNAGGNAPELISFT